LPTGSGSAPDAKMTVEDAGPRSESISVLDAPVREGIYRIGVLEKYPRLLHGISTRIAPDGADWNLSSKRGTPQHPPSVETALANRRKLATLLGISPYQVVGCQQVHGVEVALVGAEDGGRGLNPDLTPIQGADALVTATPGLYLMALSADCPPVFFYDPVRQAVGLAHSGWKGTVGRIAANVVEAMVDNFSTRPSDLIVAIGPGIGPCCYSVGPNVIEAVHDAFPYRASQLLEERDGLTFFNLRETIHHTLLEAGVRQDAIFVDEVCTADNLHAFYSHRGEKGQCGLFGAVLGMLPASRG